METENSLADKGGIFIEKVCVFISSLEPEYRTEQVIMGGLLTIVCDVWEHSKNKGIGDNEFMLVVKGFLKQAQIRNEKSKT